MLVLILPLILSVFGIVAANPINETRISGGQIAAESQFPYVVSLQLLAEVTTTTRGHRCGGVLFDPLFALTTASCLFDVAGTQVVQINPTLYRVFAGSSLLNNDTVDRVRTIVNFTIHPEFSWGPSNQNNIAVIRLSAPFNSTYIPPLPLPSSTFNPASFTMCNVSGWGGETVGTVASIQQRYASKFVYDQDVCHHLYGVLYEYINIMPSMICAASLDSLSSGCGRDLGNPLVCDGTLTGILITSNGCVSTPYPELYTRVSSYTTWIQSVSSAKTVTANYFCVFIITIYFYFN